MSPLKILEPITATDEIEPPKASLDPKYKDSIIVNAGETFVLEADFYGKPVPDITWLKEEKEIDKTISRIEVKTTSKHTMLVIKDSIRVDSGHYQLRA